MLRVCLFLALSAFTLRGADPPEPPAPGSVAVLFNDSMPASARLARLYAKMRDIPQDHLIGLDLPQKEEITRTQYRELIEQPLVDIFTEKRWWRRGPDRSGQLKVTDTKIRILVCMRGVPSRITHPPLRREDGTPVDQKMQLKTRRAAVDSELCALGNEGLPLAGPLNNPYFKSETPIAATAIPLMLVGRIDAHNFGVCEAMIRDAVRTEQTGLWGFAVVDVANKLAQGDGWLQAIARRLDDLGIPTLIDRFKPTLPVNFPLTDTALYFGWYDAHVNGPFKNPEFRFKPGAVAVHIHSFSAAQLRHAGKNWCAPLLAKGAAATVGNVYEPFLHLTHHLDVFGDRLLKGFTLAEAAYMASPAVSWQAVVLGDPLYRPFLHLDGSGRKVAADKPFRALRIAKLRWPDNDLERETQLRAAAARIDESIFLEAIGLSLHLNSRGDRASQVFRDAMIRCHKPVDKLRMDLHIARIDREAHRRQAAIRQLRTARSSFAALPEVKAVEAWLNFIDPPPPPPAKVPENR